MFDHDYLLSVSLGIINWKPPHKGTSTFVEEEKGQISVLTVDPSIAKSSNLNENAKAGLENQLKEWRPLS